MVEVLAPLRIETAVEGSGVRLTLVGELTHTTAPRFAAQLTEVLDPVRPQVLLDLAQLCFCDSVGLSALIAAQRRARLLHGEVVLSGVHGSLARALSVTGVAVLFTIVGPPDGAGAPGGRAGEPG